MSEQLIVEQLEEIFGVSQVSSWEFPKQSSLVNDEEVLVCNVHVFSNSELCFGKMNQNPRLGFGNDSWNVSKFSHNTELWTQSTEKRWNSSEIFSQDSRHWTSSRTWTIPRTNYFHVDDNDIIWWNKDNEAESPWLMSHLYFYPSKKLAGRW